MTTNRNFDFSPDKDITAQVYDNINDYLWIAFAQNTSGNCIIEKASKFSPTQTYFSLTRAVTEVNAMAVDSSKVYVAYNDSTYLGEIISTTNPLTSYTKIAKTTVESPIDVLISGSDLWFLLPGSASGTNAKLLRYNTSGVLQETIDLQESGSIVNDAKSMTIDTNNDIWIGTYTTPATIVRVYELSGGTWSFTIDNTLIL